MNCEKDGRSASNNLQPRPKEEVASKPKTSLICNKEEDPPAEFICRWCKKTFYNAKALQNHKTIHHDFDDSSTDSEHNDFYDWNLNDILEFKLIQNGTKKNDQKTDDGLIVRTFTEDISFLIVKIDCKELTIKNFDGKNRFKSIKGPVNLRGPFICNFLPTMPPELQCRRIFHNCCEYSLHYREKHTKRRKAALRCQVCEKRLDEVTPLKRVIYSCRVCGQTFLNNVDYEEHNRLKHVQMKPHQCSVCSKRFTQQGGLQQHMRMHTGIRPFACSFCPKAFTQKAGLHQHIRTHTKVKPFKCVVCSKGFSQSVHLRQHMRTHTNIQPFECSICGKRFKQSSHLNFHMRSCSMECGELAVEQYAQGVDAHEQMAYLKLASLQPVQDGETLYYAAELASTSTNNEDSYIYKSF